MPGFPSGGVISTVKLVVSSFNAFTLRGSANYLENSNCITEGEFKEAMPDKNTYRQAWMLRQGVSPDQHNEQG